MKFKLEMCCDSSAFRNTNGVVDTYEMATILERLVSHNLRMGSTGPFKLYDTNGNAVGTAYFETNARDE